MSKDENRNGLEVAVIGMAGRFPGADTIARFWENLENGVESVCFFPGQELEDLGLDAVLVNKTSYVKAMGVLEHADCFDAAFFDYTPVEAETMDPQSRIFHECAWEALEDGGYDPGSYHGLIGLYAGASPNMNWEVVSVLSGKGKALGEFAARQLSRKDYLSTLVSYRFNLRGPGVAMYTACSTSLVAIHMACQALINGECDMALAGGVTVSFPSRIGYVYQEGMVMSPDGHCRAFDARSAGMVGGNGAGIVMLKMMEDAIAHRDHIYAVIKGSAINNDGTRKLGFSAPSVEGQAQAVRSALQMAEVDPETITYVETHGTGTRLGDPVEIEGLKLAFNTNKQKFCGVGSVKTNMGHLDSAAGAAGLIKTVLALYHRLIPPSLHFENPNPDIDFENSPFYVVSKPMEWKQPGGPLRAGVSSLGIGGTNAHVVLEEWTGAPGVQCMAHGALSQGRGGVSPPDTSKEYQLILLSAKTPSALDTMTQNLVNHLKENPGINLADAAYTLAVGRRVFKYKRYAVCANKEEARQTLEFSLTSDPGMGMAAPEPLVGEEDDIPVVFMFSGQGSQYVNMGWELYREEPLFRETMDKGFDILETLMGQPVKHILYPELSPGVGSSTRHPNSGDSIINHVVYSGPIKFIFDYSLAKLLMYWGITPAAMMGHSFGEYAAACLAGVFSPEDALSLVVLRGKLMERIPEGAMLSVPLSQEQLKPLLPDSISLAAVNTSSLCYVSGPTPAIKALEKKLNETIPGCECLFINFPRAAHSYMMAPIVKEFEERANQVTFNKPCIPYISGLTGKWTSDEEAADPGYWSGHLTETIYFSDGLSLLLKKKKAIFLQVGADKGLTLFLDQHPDAGPGHLTINLLKHHKEKVSDVEYILNKIGQSWLWGKDFNWQNFFHQQKRFRIPLPTYPFERQHYPAETHWLQKGIDILSQKSSSNKNKDMADWFYIPTWTRSKVFVDDKGDDTKPLNWLIFSDNLGLGSQIAARLEGNGHHVAVVPADRDLERKDYAALLRESPGNKGKFRRILHLWGIYHKDNGELTVESPDRFLDRFFYSLLYLVQALGDQSYTGPLQIDVITNNMQLVLGDEKLHPEKAVVLGPVKVIPLEYPNIRCRSIDVVLPGQGFTNETKLVDQLTAELTSSSLSSGTIIAYRGNHRWEQTFKPIRLDSRARGKKRLKQEGVYLITGGLGGIGLVLAEHLVKTVNARLVLTGRSTLPPPEQWHQWLTAHHKEENTSTWIRIRKLQELRELGAEIMTIPADVSRLDRMEAVVADALAGFGTIDGVIHCAGLPDGALIPRRTKALTDPILAPKVKGTLVLEQVLKKLDLDFLILCSSGSAIVPVVGQLGHCAANAFLDTFAHYRSCQEAPFTISINWNAWQEVGQAAGAFKRLGKNLSLSLEKGLKSPEGIEVFMRILGDTEPQVVVSKEDFLKIVERAQSPQTRETSTIDTLLTGTPSPARVRRRPRLSSPYVGPSNETEEKLSQIWQEFFGCDRPGIHDDFFELGGDSLKALIISGKIHKVLHTKIPVAEIFNKPTISQLSEFARKNAKKNSYSPIEPVEKKDYYSVSSAQKRMFFINQLDKSSRAYNLPRVIILEGDLELEKLEQSFNGLIQRHESLRTWFELIEDQPVQIIKDQVGFEIEYYCTERKAQSTKHASITRDFIRPFDLSRAPLLRVGLAALDKEKHLVMMDMHHIIADGASIQGFIDELMTVYSGHTLPPLRIQYKDFSRWQNQMVESKEIKNQERYWLKRFEDLVPVLQMPTNFPRPQVPRFEGSSISFEIHGETSAKAKKIAAETGTTLYMLLLAVYYVLLFGYTRQEDIVVGSPASGRTHPDLLGVMGMFVNMLALRNQPRGHKTFKDFLTEVKENVLQANENQDYQFEELVNKLGIHGEFNRNPMFDTVFLLQQMENEETLSNKMKRIGQLKITPCEFENPVSLFDTRLYTLANNRKISMTMEYSTALFKKTFIKKFTERYCEVLKQVVEDIDIKLKDIVISHDLQEAAADILPEDQGDFEF